jgi:DNA ligase-associated metallophosphoesterase
MSALASAEHRAAEATPLIHFAGHNFIPQHSGALYWPSQRTLLVADLHLEKHSSFARKGSLLPPYDTGLTLRRLATDLAATAATTVIALGDSFHRDYGTATLLDADRLVLHRLTERARWIWLSGNHDPSPHALGGDCHHEFEHRGLTLTHHPRRAAGGVIAGHLHPAARVVINGRSTRRPCFVHDGQTMILPAYGSGAGSINVLSAPFSGLFAWEQLQVTMIGRDRLYPVSARRLVSG